MSNAEKLVDVQKNGLACLCFPNKNALSTAEIEAIFSAYGQIASINCAGNDVGFRFVRFQSKEDAVRCAIALKNHPSIRLQPVRGRYNNENNSNAQSNGSDWQRYKQTKEAQGILTTCTNNRENLTIEHQRPNINNHHAKNNSNNNGSRATVNGHRGQSMNFQYPENIGVNSNPTNQNRRSNRDFQFDDDNHTNENHQVERNFKNDKLESLYKLRGINAETFSVASGSTGTQSNEIIGNVSKTSIDSPRTNENACRYVNQVPQTDSDPVQNTNVIREVDSISNSSRGSNRSRKQIADAPPTMIGVPYVSTQVENPTNIPPQAAYSLVSDEKVQVIIAQCVVVANIHLNLGLSDIQQLFQKFDPIYISDIKIVPEINVRFCNVYFKTATIAIEAEKKYDKLSVCGENLIVLRPCRLEEEASIS